MSLFIKKCIFGMHYLYRRLLKCFLYLSLILPERGDSQLIFVSMKKFFLLLALVVITIGCSNQNDVLQHISRTAEEVLFNKDAGGETLVLKNATVVIDVLDDDSMIVHIRNLNGSEVYRFKLNDVTFESGKVDLTGNLNINNMYDIDFIRSIHTSEEYFRYFPNYNGHTVIICSQYGIRSVK